MSKITEKKLLDGYTRLTNCGTKMSRINGKIIRWEYRYNHDMGTAVCERDNADFISLEYGRTGKIPISRKNDNHASFEIIKKDEAEQRYLLWRDETKDRSIKL